MRIKSFHGAKSHRFSSRARGEPIRDLSPKKLKLRYADKNDGTTTAYIRLDIPLSDWLYELYPECKTLGGAVERYLRDSFRNSTVENSA